MAKRVPKYMQDPPEEKKVVSKGCNPEIELNHYVALTDENDRLQWSAGDLIREKIKETYVWNQDHRTTTKSKKGHWEIAEKTELEIFKACRYCGWIVKWKKATKKGWGVLPTKNGELIKIGRAENRKAVNVCKFVEGNKSKWHGYPIDYRDENDVICDNALLYWYKVLHVIGKSELNDIRRQLDSSLVLEV